MVSGKYVAAVVPAAGKGKRLGAKIPKPYVPILGKPLVVHTLKALFKAYPFREIILVVNASKVTLARKMMKRYGFKKVRVVSGGATRSGSVRNGLRALSDGVRWVAVHDAARPLVSREVVRRTIAAARRTGGAICAVSVSSTLKRVEPGSGRVRGTADRRGFYCAQTPQVFDRKLLLGRYRVLGPKAAAATDEAALFDGSRLQVRIVDGDERNIKVTTKTDLELAKFYLRRF